MPSLDLITPPLAEPVSLSDIKLFLRVDDTAEDALLNEMISAARRAVENASSKRLLTQTWRWTLDLLWKPEGIVSFGDPDGYVPERYADRMIRSGMWIKHQPHIAFPVRPLQEITAFTYRLDGGDADFDFSSVRALKSGEIIFSPYALPPLSDEQYGAFTITATCGYGDDASSVPEVFIQAMKQLCGHWYENRGVYYDVQHGRAAIQEMVFAVTDLVAPERRLRI